MLAKVLRLQEEGIFRTIVRYLGSRFVDPLQRSPYTSSTYYISHKRQRPGLKFDASFNVPIGIPRVDGSLNLHLSGGFLGFSSCVGRGLNVNWSLSLDTFNTRT